MTTRRVIFLLAPFTVPYGGVAVIYRHVELLAEYGLPAFVALPEEPPVDFYESHAPRIIHGGNIDVQMGDVFVIPEGFEGFAQSLAILPIRRLMFCQNQYHVPFGDDATVGIAEFLVDGVIASSEAVRSFFREVYGLTDIPLIPYAIDPSIFFPAPVKRRQIAFMPRKLQSEAEFIRSVFRRKYQRYANVPWVAIDNRTQREAAAMMADSAVFLSLSHQESFGLPPLEAMACGCLVAGFHGDGGREYMTAQNGWWAETGDWMACVDGLAAALDLVEAGGSTLAQRNQAMASTVGRYSPLRMEEALIGFWREELAKPV